MAMLTAARLRDVLNYDPATGHFRWRVTDPHGGRIRKGSLAGTTSNERPCIKIDGRLYRSSRLAVLWMTGEWPRYQVDHRNLDPTDNRWRNLREATNAQNRANSHPKGALGFKGVQYDSRGKRKYVARITVDRRTIRLGCFSTPEEAHAAYCKAARKHFGAFAKLSSGLNLR